MAVLLAALFGSASSFAQTVQPLIQEYRGKASGQITLTNTTLQPLVVVLEPKSFSITPEGKGMFRPLDPGIHIQLSTQSVKLLPQQSYHVFYKASADTYPAWFTVYAAFTPVQHADQSINIRIMLPHTVYLYQKDDAKRDSIAIKSAVYHAKTQKLDVDLEQTGNALIRVTDVTARGHDHSQELAGFPLLPQSDRRVEFDWNGKEQPDNLVLQFEHFTLTHPVTTSGE